MIARANLAAAGFSKRSLVLVGDYRSIVMLESPGATLYVGNPPYVRHHQIDATAKQWLTTTAAQLGHDPSQLSGLHVYFFLVTAMKARVGDFGAFITAAEWLDVNCRRMFPTKVQGYEIRRWRKHALFLRLFRVDECYGDYYAKCADTELSKPPEQPSITVFHSLQNLRGAKC